MALGGKCSGRPEGYDETGISPTSEENRVRHAAIRPVQRPGRPPRRPVEGRRRAAPRIGRLRASASASRRHDAQQGGLPGRPGPDAAPASPRCASISGGSGCPRAGYDFGRGEIEDFRAALDEAERSEGLPIVAAGFSFGSAVGLKTMPGDARIEAFVALGLPLASESGRGIPLPRFPRSSSSARRTRSARPRSWSAFSRRTGRRRRRSGRRSFLRGRPREGRPADRWSFSPGSRPAGRQSEAS